MATCTITYLADPYGSGESIEILEPKTVTMQEETTPGGGGGGGSDTPSGPSYTITYYSDHANIPPKSVALSNPVYTLTSADLPTLTYSGYAFDGWYRTAAPIPGGGMSYSDPCIAGITEITGSVTLYAKWTQAPTPTP